MPEKDLRKHAHITCGTVVVAPEPGLPTVLIRVQRQTGVFWGLPKGHVDNGESLAQAAIRETAEETGLKPEGLTLAAYLGNIHYEFVTHEGEKTLNEKEVHFFLVLASPICVELLPRYEEEGILEARWFPLTEAKKTVSYKNYKRILSIASRALNQPC